MIRRYGQGRVTSSAKFGGQSQGGLGTVNKVIVADVIKAAVIDEKSIAPASAKWKNIMVFRKNLMKMKNIRKKQ